MSRGSVPARWWTRGLAALCRLDHRGARGADPNTGDGAGLLLQMPDDFFRAATATMFELPPRGEYATGLVFLPPEPARAEEAVTLVHRIAEEEGASILGWRDVPTNATGLGAQALAAMPRFGKCL